MLFLEKNNKGQLGIKIGSWLQMTIREEFEQIWPKIALMALGVISVNLPVYTTIYRVPCFLYEFLQGNLDS